MRDLPFDVKLPAGFFVPRENGNSSTHEAEQDRLNREVAEHFASDKQPQSADAHENDGSSTSSGVLEASVAEGEESAGEYTVKSVSQRGTSKIEIMSKKRKSNQLEETTVAVAQPLASAHNNKDDNDDGVGQTKVSEI